MNNIEKAKQNLKDFLERKPHLKEKQVQIEKLLSKIPTSIGKLEALSMMIESNSGIIAEEFEKIVNMIEKERGSKWLH